MATALDLLNNVLRGLRRDVLQATSTTDAYQLMLIQYLNLAKDRIEEQWDWQALRQTVTVTLAANTQTYTLKVTGGSSDIDVPDNSRLLYEKHVQYGFLDMRLESSQRTFGSAPQVFDVTSAAEVRLDEIPWEQFEEIFQEP